MGWREVEHKLGCEVERGLAMEFGLEHEIEGGALSGACSGA